jgi:hypothetical protein
MVTFQSLLFPFEHFKLAIDVRYPPSKVSLAFEDKLKPTSVSLTGLFDILSWVNSSAKRYSLLQA